MNFRYFKALAAGEVAPVKDRLDRNPPSNINDLSKGQLAMLHNQVTRYMFFGWTVALLYFS